VSFARSQELLMSARSLCLGLWAPALLWPAVLAAAAPAAGPEVAVSRPLAREVTDYEEFTGRTEAVQAVDLRARVTGYVDKVNVKEGGDVKPGDVLFEIDPRPYQAEFDRADAEVARAEAHLKRVSADFDRAKKALSSKAVSQDDFDHAAGDKAEAEASLRAAQAAREVAKLNLSFTRVTAPIAGKVGRALLTPGNLAVADTTTLATIVSVDPMSVAFDVDERTLVRLARLQREGKGKAERDAEPTVLLALPDNEGFVHRGKLAGTDVRVDPSTGAARWRAIFANPDGLFLPGMFVRVRIPMGAPYKALLVPERAVGRDQEAFVFVVTDKNAVERRPVKLGAQDDGLRVVKEGLKAEDRVVVDEREGRRPELRLLKAVKTKEVPIPAPKEKPGQQKSPSPDNKEP
jgi:RND family efflux transporter MFP subunit